MLKSLQIGEIMKKLIGLLIGFFITFNSAYSADMRFIQVDSVLFSPTDEQSVTQLKNLINDINVQKNVEFVIFSGDNIAKAKKENLESFLKLAKKLKQPYYLVLGSKDVNKQKGLGKKEYMKIVSENCRAHKKIESPNYVFEKRGVIFIVLDGAREVIPSPMGYYKEDTLNWLENTLSYYRDKKIVIIQHFPIIAPVKKESRYTFKPARYLELLQRYSNVKAIYAGNFGVNNEQNINGVVHVSTANAPLYRIVDIIDIDTSNPEFWSVIKE